MKEARWTDALRKRALGLSGGKNADDSNAERVGDVERSGIVTDERPGQRDGGSRRRNRTVTELIDEYANGLRPRAPHLSELARCSNPQHAISTLMQQRGEMNPLAQRHASKGAAGERMESDKARCDTPADHVAHGCESTVVERVVQLTGANPERREQPRLLLQDWFPCVFSRKHLGEKMRIAVARQPDAHWNTRERHGCSRAPGRGAQNR